MVCRNVGLKFFSFSILLVFLWALVWWMDRYSLGYQLGVYMFAWGSVGNALPFVFLFVLGLLAFNRLIASFFVALLAGIIFYYINYKKNQYLGKPLSEEDFFFLNNLDGNAIDLFKGYVDLWKVSIFLFVFIFIAFLFIFFETRFFTKNSKARYIGGVVVIGVGVWFLSLGGIGKVYDFKLMRFSWNGPTSTLHAGVVSKIIYSLAKLSSANDEPVDVRDINFFVEKFSSISNLVEGYDKPDVIIIQSEAFSNPTLFNKVDDLHSLLPVYAKAIEQGNTGYMKVPTFGGGTIRTEYEVLSGVPLFALPKIEFPYMQIKAHKVETLASEFGRNGYSATAIHANSGNFWNRKKFFERAGFDKFITIEDFPSYVVKDGFFMSDKSMTDVVISQFANGEEKKFIFAVSIEAHGPYESNDTREGRINKITLPDGLSAQSKIEYENYIYHISNADAELGRLHDYLELRGKPYILVFYGDHLPAFNSLYKDLSFKNGLPAKAQLVPWVMFSNVQNGSLVAPESWLLGAAVVNKAKLNTSAYFQLINRFSIDSKASNDERVAQALLSIARSQSQGKFGEHIKVGGITQ